jgi:hypothetical protein
MKKIVFIALVALASLGACNSPKQLPAELDQMVYDPEDKAILEKVFEANPDGKGKSVRELMVSVGTFFLGTPYVAHTVEKEKEVLVVDLREFDCTTFAESCLASARTIHSGDLTFEHFASELLGIRYRDGSIHGYPSRIHYFSDWILTNQQKGVVKDVTEASGGISIPIQVNFMSSHPESYKHLKADPDLIGIIAGQEKEISMRTMHYIPTDLLAGVESKLQEGDIAGITTNIDGLDIVHVGILVRRDARIHFLHASSKGGQVEITEYPLEDYLKGRENATGIMVARPQ